MTGTEIRAITKRKTASSTDPATTASVIVAAVQPSPAAFPPSTAATATPAAGIKMMSPIMKPMQLVRSLRSGICESTQNLLDIVFYRH